MSTISRRGLLGGIAIVGMSGTESAAESAAAKTQKTQRGERPVTEISSVRELAEFAAKSGNHIRMKPGVYRVADFLTDDEIARIRAEVPTNVPGRPPVWMLRFSGSNNRFDLSGVVLEIDTSLYPKLPRGYVRCLFVPGNNNILTGLTITNTGPNQGSNGNILSVWGDGCLLEDISLYVHGSAPYGYGDLLGKGGPNLVGLQKQSGIMVAGRRNTLRRCRVVSRAFGHCFYIQKPEGLLTDDIRLEDCYAEGVTRSTADMLRETSGPLAALQFGTIAENRDGRYIVVPGYRKALGEDGFRTYGGTGRITLINCTAIHTRAGFEIAGPDDAAVGRTVIDGGTALGCERAYLIGSNTTVRRSRGDTQFGPLLYLRGGRDSDVELEWTGDGSDYTVHALATIAGEGHRVVLFTREQDRPAPSVPIYLGYGMPAHAEMASPIRPAATKGIRLTVDLDRIAVIQEEEATDCTVKARGPVQTNTQTRRLPDRPK
ncbi:MAG: hypothetical protein V4671_20095 [Armatimonadota bacterium]